MRSEFNWTDAAQTYLEEMARDGMTGGQIGKVLGITRNAVLGRAHRTNVRLGQTGQTPRPANNRGGRGHYERFSHEQKLLVLSAYYAGMNAKAAGALIGVSHVSVHNWLNKLPELCARARGVAFAARYACGASTVEQPRAEAAKAPTMTGKSRRGFASMSPERRLEIARKGGAATKPENRSFSKNAELAKEAGRKGGLRRAVGHGFA